MDTDIATDLLSALANPHRLEAFRLLAKHSPQGLAAGDIADALSVTPSALSFHLGHLERCGLIAARRDGRRIIYGLEPERMRALLGFLTHDCCGGKPELCGVNAKTNCG